MRLTSARTATTLVLVDPAVGGFQPIPSFTLKQVVENYHIDNGATKYVLHGQEVGPSAPAVVLIDQASDLISQTMLQQLRDLVADVTEQPFDVDWNDYADTIWDGPHLIVDLGTPEVSYDLPGRIQLAMQMIPVP